MTREELFQMVELLRDTAKLHQPNEEILTDVKAESFIFVMDSVLSALSENKGEWIPVSERLPKDDEDVLVYCGQYSGQGVMNIAYYHSDYTFYPSEYADLNETGWYDENDDAMYHEPIAWMPLPEPYKEGGE